jgi:hypothetical protein
MTRLEYALEQIRLARRYTCWLVEAVEPGQWFRIPPAGVTHIAWQVGHLAMAQYRLCIERIRGVRPEDNDFVSEGFLALFGRGSLPEADPGKYPPADEIRAVFDRMHEQILKELAGLSDRELDDPPLLSHPQFTTKYGALTWAVRHEMLHAGQIGLLRRQLGAPSLR